MKRRCCQKAQSQLWLPTHLQRTRGRAISMSGPHVAYKYTKPLPSQSLPAGSSTSLQISARLSFKFPPNHDHGAPLSLISCSLLPHPLLPPACVPCSCIYPALFLLNKGSRPGTGNQQTHSRCSAGLLVQVASAPGPWLPSLLFIELPTHSVSLHISPLVCCYALPSWPWERVASSGDTSPSPQRTAFQSGAGGNAHRCAVSSTLRHAVPGWFLKRDGRFSV